MSVFKHCLYEYSKGVRSLVLHTCKKEVLVEIESKLKSIDVSYAVFQITDEKFNLFFGKKSCVEVIEKIGKSFLNEYSPEEDFILGIMLGYSREKQCERYIKMQNELAIKNDITLLTA